MSEILSELFEGLFDFDFVFTKESIIAYFRTIFPKLINYLWYENYELYVIICVFILIVLLKIWGTLKEDGSYPSFDK